MLIVDLSSNSVIIRTKVSPTNNDIQPPTNNVDGSHSQDVLDHNLKRAPGGLAEGLATNWRLNIGNARHKLIT
mgnify:CR=1 FL=1